MNNTYNIDEYIQKTATMDNTSDGGSAAYHFDDVVLIKYVINSKYGFAREDEELIALEANKKREKGVRTPAHLAIKRVRDEKYDICWVLQERAKGVCYSQYNSYNNDPQTQLVLQEKILNAPNSHYEHCIKDICELFNMGLELKDKNIYYDDDKENGGFIFIDLLRPNPKPIDLNSISDLYWLKKYCNFIYNIPLISHYNDNATEQEKGKSDEICYKMKQKTFTAIEKVVPNFEHFRRWILRTYSKDELDFFEKNGTFIGDLTLNEEEYKEFDYYIEMLVNKCLDKIISGKYKFWQIRANEIRNGLDSMGLQDSWKYHRSNEVKRADFEDDYDYYHEMGYILQDKVNDIFNSKLESLVQISSNDYVLQAINDLNESKKLNLSK